MMNFFTNQKKTRIKQNWLKELMRRTRPRMSLGPGIGLEKDKNYPNYGGRQRSALSPFWKFSMFSSRSSAIDLKIR